MQTRQWTLTNKPTALPTLSGPKPTFTLNTITLPTLQPGQVLTKPLYLSNDPGMRPWISAAADPARQYLPPIHEGDAMRTAAIVRVVESTSSKLPVNILVFAFTEWRELSIHDESECQPLTPIPGLDIAHFLGAFGMPAITAYYGLKEIVKVQPGETVVVSGAAGATGSMAVQIARKLLGCRVIGIAGTDEKCKWVRSLGAEECVNYRSESFEEDLFKATEGYVEVYFDNVGGTILDLMLTRLKRFGRIASCGTISTYNSTEQTYKNLFEITQNRLSMHGFFAYDYLPHIPATTELLVQAWKDGKIVLDDEMQTIVDAGFEDVPGVWLRLFEGNNTGKLCTKIV
ncbi:MDR family NADP-dependent oxidoreductase [Aspergillus ruber CBS 135680]|uniref:NAD(P)-binding protein n=1 Tax=Aspergillus ruber (strain CBS 135680) TaxID=1388766 RepID=A0A017S630_ASPRC|nr:NAD(P)-binding protein [Aspergillus ruber CBS 135680]EYE92054.1 NAD(P)-binding protein [Aspergillus ruber CBS 135680]